MTTIESVCVKCINLYPCMDTVCISKSGTRSLIASCRYGGKNAGNRKKCKDFSPAPAREIDERETLLKGAENEQE